MNLFRGDCIESHQVDGMVNPNVVWSSGSSGSSKLTHESRGESRLQNDFDPFRRLANRAFTRGRPRAVSVDARSNNNDYQNNDFAQFLRSLPPLPPIRRRRSSSCLLVTDLDTIKEENQENPPHDDEKSDK